MLTVVVANVTPQEAAAHYAAAGISGTASASVGFGAWGIEPGARIEFAAPSEWDRAELATRELCAILREQCALVATAAGAALLYPDGRREPLA